MQTFLPHAARSSALTSTRCFDRVLLTGYIVKSASPESRVEMLRVCRETVLESGAVVIQRRLEGMVDHLLRPVHHGNNSESGVLRIDRVPVVSELSSGGRTRIGRGRRVYS